MSQALTRSTATSAPPVRAGAVVGVLAFAGITASTSQSVMVPLLPRLPALLQASPSATAWAVTATLLAAAVATPVAGRLGDMYGKRRMLLITLCMLVTGSAVSALSTSLAPLLVGRTIQGLAVGVVPLGISIMRDTLPRERLGSATATMSSSLGVGAAVGLPAAAIIVENASWHVLFWTSAGLGVIATALVLRFVPESSARTGGRFDTVGAIGLSAALVSLLLAVAKGADWGWGNPVTVCLAVAAVVLLLAWGRWELHTRWPLVDLRTNGRAQVLLTNLASLVLGFSMFSSSLVLPQLLQLPTITGYGLGQSLLVVGLTLAPQGVAMMLVAPLSARISAARGPKTTIMLGAVVIAVGYGLGIFLMSAVWQLVLVCIVIGAGVGLAYGAMPALVMAAVPVSQTASANSFNTLMRAIGTSLASAVAGTLMAHLVTHVGDAAFPSQAGLRLVLAIGGAAALTATIVAAFLRGGPRPIPSDSAH